MTRMRVKELLWPAAIVGLFILLTFVRNILVFQDHCFHCVDFGLFTEALWKIAHGDWNPYLNTRQLAYFNDHWEPLFFIAGLVYRPFAEFIPSGIFLLFIDCAIFATAGLLLYKNTTDRRFAVVILAALLWNTNWISATHYPVRASNWGILGMALLVIFIYREFIERQIVAFWKWAAALIFLSLANEQHAVAAAVFSLVYLFCSQRKSRWPAVALAGGLLLQALIAFDARALIVGPVKDYSYYFPKNFEGLIGQYAPFSQTLSRFAGFFLPIGAIVFLVFRRRENIVAFLQDWKVVLLWGSLFGPGLLGKFLAGTWSQYYAATVALAAVSLGILIIRNSSVSKSVMIFGCLLPFAGLTEDVKQVVQAIRYDQSNQCFDGYRKFVSDGQIETRAAERNQNLQRVHEFLKQEIANRPGERLAILGSDMLVPTLNSKYPQADFFIMGEREIRNKTDFDIVIYERNEFGNPWPISPANAERALAIMRAQLEIETVYESNSLIILRGKIAMASLKEFYQAPDVMKDSKLRKFGF